MSDDHQLGDAPIEDAYREKLITLAMFLDEHLNDKAKGQDREVGFVLLTFPFGATGGRCNFLSNGADRQDLVILFREMIARFEGMPEVVGHA